MASAGCVTPRWVANAPGLRDVLIGERDRSLLRWEIPGKPDAFLTALRAGEPVLVSDAQLMCALMHAGMPADQFAYGGVEYGKRFVLDQQDRLIEQSVA
jgi:hypothetical protein